MKILITESQIKMLLDTIVIADENDQSKSSSLRGIIAAFTGKNIESDEIIKIN